MAMGSEDVKEKKSEADLGKIVEECLKQLQAQASVSNKNERPGNVKRGKCRCWCCGKEGHFLMQCPTVKQNRAAQKEAAREKSENEKGARLGRSWPLYWTKRPHWFLPS